MPVCIPEYPPYLRLRITLDPEVQNGSVDVTEPLNSLCNFNFFVDVLFCNKVAQIHSVTFTSRRQPNIFAAKRIRNIESANLILNPVGYLTVTVRVTSFIIWSTVRDFILFLQAHSHNSPPTHTLSAPCTRPACAIPPSRFAGSTQF